MMKQQKEIEQAQSIAKRAIKIALLACVITILFSVLSLWVLLNQITATANLTKNQKDQAVRLEKLESMRE